MSANWNEAETRSSALKLRSFASFVERYARVNQKGLVRQKDMRFSFKARSQGTSFEKRDESIHTAALI